MLSCEYREIFKSTYFEEHLRTSASEIMLIRGAPYPTGIYLVKVSIENTKTICEISSKLTIKTSKRVTHWSCASIVGFAVSILEVRGASDTKEKRRLNYLYKKHLKTKAAIRRCSLTQVFSSEYCEIFKSSFFYRTPLVAVFIEITTFVWKDIFSLKRVRGSAR